MNSRMRDARLIVVKVGSALVTNEGAGLDREAIARWAAQVSVLRAAGKEGESMEGGGWR